MKKPPDSPHKHHLWLQPTLAATLALLVLGWLSWDAYTDYCYVEVQLPATARMEVVRAEIISLDEALTMSAQLAAASGNPNWETRYRLFESQLDQSIKEALRLDPNASQGAAAAKTDAANVALVAMKHHAFELVRQGKNAEAQRLLSSEEYEDQRKIYAAGMTEFNLHLLQFSDSMHKELLADMRRDAITTIALAMLLILGSLFAFLVTRRWQTVIVESNRKLNQTAAELEGLNNQLEDKVRERTREFNDSALASLNMMEDAVQARDGLESANEQLRSEINERKRLELEREQYYRFFMLSTNAMCIADPYGCFKQVNPAFVKLTGYSESELLAKPFLDFVLPEDRQNTMDEMKLQVEIRPTLHFENRYVCKDGTVIRLLWTSYFDRHENATYATADDITERNESEARIKYLTRVYAMLSGINALIVRVRDRDELFTEACRIALEAGGFRMALIVKVDRGSMRLVPVASAGKDQEILAAIKDVLNSVEDAPNTMIARVIREKTLLVSNDTQSDPRLLLSKNYAEAGVHSLAIFPLIVEDEAAGAIAIYASEIEFFHEEETKLLAGLAGDIAYALDHIGKAEKIARLSRIQAVMSGINAAIVRAQDRQELFNETCRVAVEQGNFGSAWVGVLDSSTLEAVQVACAGQDLHPAGIQVRIDVATGLGVASRAIREKRVVFDNDIVAPSSARGERRALAIRAGFHSMIALPFVVDDVVVGHLSLYTKEPNFFNEDELQLLTELADNISFALQSIDKRQKLEFLSYYDELTGLANRSLFLDRVAQYLRSAASSGHQLALILIDLERFKNINDSLGRATGDALLQQAAEWLKHAAGDANLVARLDADHFAAVLPVVKPGGNLPRLIEKSMASIQAHPFRLNETVLRVAVKVGVALYPDDGADAETLFRNAEAALKMAKASGDRYLFHTQKMTTAVPGNLTLENQLRQALDNDEFVLHYQPKVNLASGQVTSAEALIRWNDPRTGLVPPGRFIPVLEDTGLIFEVGRWAIKKAIADYLRWRASGLNALRVAVNVSPLQLRRLDFIAEIRQAISIDTHAAAGLELEITESLIMENIAHNTASLQAIRDLGITIAIDDFGTGFSSLSYLAKLPVDTLKIDRSFVLGITVGPEGLALVSTIIKLAHALHLKVVAEGVDAEEQSRLLRLLECDEMQGYLFSKPVPSEIFEARFLAPASGT